jgi:hypothetical protein
MTNTIGNAQDPALQPAAAAARQVDAGEEATRKVVEQDNAAGRVAVQPVKPAGGAEATEPEPHEGTRGKLLDKTV